MVRVSRPIWRGWPAIEPSRVGIGADGELMNRGLVTNDRFDPLRAGSQATLRALSEASSSRRAGLLTAHAASAIAVALRPEGRWSRLDPGRRRGIERCSPGLAFLLERYGVLTREVVALEPSAPTWAELAPLLSRSEWRGELRRGYFVEGLSGVQYASAEAAGELARLARPRRWRRRRSVLVCTTDPANLYGAGAPLDVELLDGGSRGCRGIPGNFLVLRAGRPILIIESIGKRLTGLASASQTDIDSALNLLPSFTGSDRRILKVESYNGAPAVGGPGGRAIWRNWASFAIIPAWLITPAGQFIDAESVISHADSPQIVRQ